MVDTSDEWIRQRTGISERRIAEDDVATSDLCIHAARWAIKNAHIDPLDIEMILVATVTPDRFFPSTACYVQKGIGAKNAAAMDISAACAGFLYGLDLADGLIRSGRYNTILVVGGEIFNKIVDWNDRNTCVLFGDGAGAAVVQATDESKGILASYIGSDGDYADVDLLGIPADKIQMNGREVFKLGVRLMPEAAQRVLRQANVSVEDIDLLIPHQANLRIIEAVGDRLGMPREKVYINVDKYGNTSAATVIIALDEAIREGRAKPGDLLLLVTFGAGLTWGSTLLRL
ncbi:3-oxoacyl-[acyl-carrier-protein] synthase 3 protein 1 [Geodia barretti]|uniref:beta-ketoacyl-[acyl-carrier-protein] synthase III n=1 Tax=Geodia barretti TaxID=519541 RepID=A0AA35SH28_GEOBA|nr:3-oxoacyl-[acyl-carrier-protein] synthase 3 protein 1 [Geodia barretti]